MHQHKCQTLKLFLKKLQVNFNSYLYFLFELVRLVL